MDKLSLLVIDMGENCVVQIEKGSALWPVPKDNGGVFGRYHLAEGDAPVIYPSSFAELRLAIGGGEKPVPRIERDNIDASRNYRIYRGEAWEYLSYAGYDALCQIAGAPLPVWTPARGEWKRIASIPRVKLDEYYPVWRYTEGG